MPVFEYKATDPNGTPISGTLFSNSLIAAAEQLSQRGFSVQHVALAPNANDPIPADFQAPRPQASGSESSEETQNPKSEIRDSELIQDPYSPPPTTQRSAIVTGVIAPLVYRVPLSQLLFFFRQLATMLNAGVPVVSSLDTLSRQTRDPKINTVVKELLGHVREGRELSVGMRRYPDVFSPLMLSLIRAGEESGLLDKALNQMADYIEREIRLRNLIRKATLYPKIVIGASILIILAANYIIQDVFAKPGGLTSPLTEPATWVILAPLIFFLFIFVRVGLPNPKVKQGWDQFLLMVPAVGGTVHQMAMAKVARAFATLYKGGVPMPKAVDLSADACGNSHLRSLIKPASRQLDEGMGITVSLAQTGAFTQQVLDMTQTGETTGRIDDMLDKVADYYEDDSEVRANQLAIIFGVICFLCVAVYVAYIVIKFWSGHASTLQAE